MRVSLIQVFPQIFIEDTLAFSVPDKPGWLKSWQYKQKEKLENHLYTNLFFENDS